MKICFFVDSYYKGGVDTFLLNLLNSWPGKNDQIVLLHNYNHPSIEQFTQLVDKRIHFKSYHYILCNDFFMGKYIQKWNNTSLVISQKILIRIIRNLLMPFYFFKLAILLNNYKNHKIMVINGGYPGSIFSRLATLIPVYIFRKRVVFNFHSHAVELPGKFSIIEKYIDRLMRNNLITFVSVSKSCIVSIKKRLKYESSNFKVIYNGISDPLGNQKRSDYKRNKSRKYILMLATLHPYKGHEFLLESFSLLKQRLLDIELKIFGDGDFSDQKRIQRIIDKLNLNESVEFGDFLKDVNSLITNASVLVLPSQAYESFGYVIIEAFARKVPVIATNVGGIPEVIEHGKQGYISDPRNSQLFSDYLYQILVNENLQKSMAESGRQRYLKHFTADKMAQAYYNNFLEKN